MLNAWNTFWSMCASLFRAADNIAVATEKITNTAKLHAELYETEQEHVVLLKRREQAKQLALAE